MNPRARFWISLLGYQTVWFITVASASTGRLWPALAATAAFCGWQILSSDRALNTLLVAIAGIVCGLLLDGALAISGLIGYSLPSPAVPNGGAPLWILCLWASFSLTLEPTLSCLHGRAWLAVTLGALGAPLAYSGAARGWQAVSFPAPQWQGYAALALGWAVLLPLLSVVSRRLMRSSPLPI